MPATKLKQFLDSNQIRYITITHSTAYTAQAIAALAHIPGKELAKTVVIKVDGNLALAVLPASKHVDLLKLRAALNADSVVLATETEFQDAFPDCEVGAMPPFGNLYGMKVYVDSALTRDIEIAFNAGTHRELLRVTYKDFERLVAPVVLDYAVGTSSAKVA